MRINRNFWQILFVIAGLTIFSACQSNAGKSGAAATGTGATPTEAYKSLYAAVKSKNTDDIKANMSKTTVQFVEEFYAPMQKKQPAEVFANGMTETTFAAALPPIRNERIKDNMGAIEVQSPKGNWEDLPFVLEDGRWKLAVGDLFQGKYNKPAPSQAETEANNNAPQIMPGTDITNQNAPVTNANPMNGKPAPDKKQPAAEKPEKK